MKWFYELFYTQKFCHPDFIKRLIKLHQNPGIRQRSKPVSDPKQLTISLICF